MRIIRPRRILRPGRIGPLVLAPALVILQAHCHGRIGAKVALDQFHGFRFHLLSKKKIIFFKVKIGQFLGPWASL